MKKANVTPTASASILVAIASTIIVLKSTLSLLSSSFSNDSLIIFNPINDSSIKAIQWSIIFTASLNEFPKKYPIDGMKA